MTKIYGYDTNIYETTIGNISNYCQKIKGTQYYTEEYVKILQQKVEQLKKENKILRENAEHNDKVVDDMRWKNLQLENIRKEAIEEIQRVLDIWTNKPNEIATLDLEYLLDILNKGDNNGK